MDEEIRKTLIPHLGGQFERALPILFTGAGFSADARNIRGEAVPSYLTLKKELWALCFPGDPFDEAASLQDLYGHAYLRHRPKLTELLTALLSVEADSLPDWYQTILSVPWARAYTLNVDDLAVAASRKFKLPRGLVTISATARAVAGSETQTASDALEVVHLNGTISDIPDAVTFSTTQYAERLARSEPWYIRLAADLLSRSCVFIGTRLDEPPLWQHIELRRMRGERGVRELRPRSYLVTQNLDRAREALLAEFNIFWVQMTGEQFVKEILGQLEPAVRLGLERLGRIAAGPRREKPHLADVASLATNPMQQSEFLLGQEPIWADLQASRAIMRESDAALWNGVNDRLQHGGLRGLIVVTGTAGSGKSTALMRVCLRLIADGVRVGWIDRMADLSPREIRLAMQSDDAPPVLAIDDADLYGTSLASLVREVALGDRAPLVIVAVRSGKLDRALNPVLLRDVPISEFSMPHLADADISALLDVLDRANRLGILKGKRREEQERAFRQQAGRQLLVAMIQATSDDRFEKKVLTELTDLEPDAQTIYALAAVASAFRFGLSRDEILIASGDRSNTALNVLDRLVGRHILIVAGDGAVWARHRVIAEILLDELQKTGQLHEVLSGLALIAATKVTPRRSIDRLAPGVSCVRYSITSSCSAQSGSRQLAICTVGLSTCFPSTFTIGCNAEVWKSSLGTSVSPKTS